MKNRILKQLEIFKTRDYGDYIEIDIPVALDFNFRLLSLRIYPLSLAEGYYISDIGGAFSERYNDTTKYYFNMFTEDDRNEHFGIQVANDYFYKKYEFNFSVIVAINEFVRFFVYLDDYIMNNNAKVFGLGVKK